MAKQTIDITKNRIIIRPKPDETNGTKRCPVCGKFMR